MIVWNVVGHTVLGFEQSWATPLVAIATAIAVSMLLDWVDARASDRELRFAGSLGDFLNFLPACLIPGFACGMLLYPNERLWPLVFAVVLSIGSKLILRAPVGNGHTQHIFNPSNLGVAATLLLFPEVCFAPPYHFTENITGLWDWGDPADRPRHRHHRSMRCSPGACPWWRPGSAASSCRVSFAPTFSARPFSFR